MINTQKKKKNQSNEDFPIKKSHKRILRDSVRETEMKREMIDYYMNDSVHDN